MSNVLYLRTDPAEGVVERRAPADLLAEGGSLAVRAQTPVSLRESGPFEPLGTAIGNHDALRDVLARDIPIPSLRNFARVRFAILGAVVLPLVMLIELDRELVARRSAGPERLILDLVLAAFVVFELTRRTPRRPGIAAVALTAVALRWILVATKSCGHHVHPLVWAAATLALAGAFVLLLRVPSKARVTLELLGKLGISRSELFRATDAREPPGALVAAAVACAAGLPALLHVGRMFDASLVLQAAACVLFATVAPVVARRTTDEPGVPRSAPPPMRVVRGVFVGLTLTAAAVTAGRLFFDTGTELARCVAHLDAEARLAKSREAAELGRAIASVRSSTALVLMTTAIFPFVEERIYRGLLQDVLTRKYGTYGVFAASVAFGLAHLGIYQVALYQTVLLGIGFGVAFAEGGLLAAFVVHAAWNVLQLV